MFRIGNGYDVHKLTQNRKLILGGVEIPHHLGLLGHSDADVLAHAIMDALCGAGAFGDIGKLFPDTDEKYKNADSILLLKRVVEILKAKGYKIVNVDSIIVAQKPKLAPYIEKMREHLAAACEIEVSQMSVKATTEEHLGFTGREEGMASYAVCLIENLE